MLKRAKIYSKSSAKKAAAFDAIACAQVGMCYLGVFFECDLYRGLSLLISHFYGLSKLSRLRALLLRFLDRVI